MNLINTDRLEQLQGRYLILRLNHDKLHGAAFPKDGNGGEYKKHQNLRSEFYQKHKTKDNGSYDIFKMKDAPCEWEDTELSKQLKKSLRILNKVHREMLAILYYEHIFECKLTVHKIFDETNDKYNDLFDYRKIDKSICFPKTKEEIAEKEIFDNATFIEKLDLVNYDYQVGDNKEANDKCHNIVKDICEVIFSDKKVNKESVEAMINAGIGQVAKICPIVEDKESVRAIERPIQKALKECDYSFEIDTYN